jgi:hypothetical protein
MTRCLTVENRGGLWEKVGAYNLENRGHRLYREGMARSQSVAKIILPQSLHSCQQPPFHFFDRSSLSPLFTNCLHCPDFITTVRESQALSDERSFLKIATVNRRTVEILTNGRFVK